MVKVFEPSFEKSTYADHISGVADGVLPSGGFTPWSEATRNPAVVQLGPVAGVPAAQVGTLPGPVMIRSRAPVKLAIWEASRVPGAAEFFVIQRTGFVAPG